MNRNMKENTLANPPPLDISPGQLLAPILRKTRGGHGRINELDERRTQPFPAIGPSAPGEERRPRCRPAGRGTWRSTGGDSPGPGTVPFVTNQGGERVQPLVAKYKTVGCSSVPRAMPSLIREQLEDWSMTEAGNRKATGDLRPPSGSEYFWRSWENRPLPPAPLRARA